MGFILKRKHESQATLELGKQAPEAPERERRSQTSGESHLGASQCPWTHWARKPVAPPSLPSKVSCSFSKNEMLVTSDWSCSQERCRKTEKRTDKCPAFCLSRHLALERERAKGPAWPQPGPSLHNAQQ